MHQRPERERVPENSLRNTRVEGIVNRLGFRAGGGARLLWRTTNAVCEAAFGGDYAAARDMWAAPATAAAAEADCRRVCPRFSQKRPCLDEVFSRRATELQRDASLRALGDRAGVGILDAWKVTANAGCGYTFFRDGRHFDALDDVLALEAIARLLPENLPSRKAALADLADLAL